MRWFPVIRRKTALTLAAAAATLAAMTALRAIDPPLVTAVRELTFDSYQRLELRPYADLPVRVVDIDEASLAAFGQWPWPRTRLAGLARRLGDLGAAAIAFDVIFAEPDRTSPAHIARELDLGDPAETQRVAALMAGLPDHDQVFAAALEAVPAITGFAIVPDANDRRPAAKAGIAFAGASPAAILMPFAGAATNLPVLDQAASGVGGVSLSRRDSSGVVRRVPMLFSDGTRIYPGLVIEALRVAQAQKSVMIRSTGASGDADTGRPALLDLRVGEFRVPVTADGELWMRYDRDRAERYVSARDVLDPAKEAEVRPRLEGQIVFVGTSSAGLLDIRATALGETVPGVSIHAQAAEQILAQSFLSRPDWADGLEIVATAILGVIVTALLLGLGAHYSFAAGALVAVLAVGASWFLFSQHGLLLDALFPSLGALATYLAVMAVLYIATDREKRFVRQAFGQYLAPELLAKLEQAPQSMRLGGEIRPMSIMFMDVRGFTPISESLSATDLVQFLNTLLSPLSNAIQAELGTIDKYIGDSIMAFWNAPVDVPDHPVRACRAALRMREIVRAMNAEDAFGFAARGRADLVVRIGVGINTGEACVGNMGSQRRFNYSVIGDAVNTASRIESSCKAVGADLLVSEDTAAAAPGFAMLEAGEVALKGKARPAKLYALVGDETVAASPAFQALARHHGVLLAALAAGDATAAATALVACRALAEGRSLAEGGPLADGQLAAFYDGFEDRLRALAPAAPRPVAVAAR